MTDSAGQAAPPAALSPPWRRRLEAYGLALLFVAAAALAREVMGDVLSSTPLLVFCLAWVAAAAFGGLGPGLLATVASWLCVDFFFDSSPGHVGFSDPASTGRFVVLLMGGLAVSLMGEKMRRAHLRARRQAEKLAAANAALRASEAGLAAAQRRAHIGSWQWNIVDDTARWSDETFRIFGLAPGPLQEHRQDFISMIVPQDRERVDQALSDALSGARDYDLDYRIQRADGRERVIHAQAQVVRAGNGRPVLMHGTVQDVTERQQAGEELRESEEKYRRIVETATEAIVMVDAEGRIVFVNDRWSEFVGYSREETAPMTIFDLVFPEDLAVTRQRWESRKQGRKERYEFRLRRKDGSAVWALIGMSPRFGSAGEFLGELVMAVDITQRRQAEEELAESRKRYRGLVEKINDWVWEVDAECVYTYSSPRALELLGYAPEEIVGRTPFDLMPPDEAQRVWNALEPIWRERKPFTLLENTLLCRDGRLVAVETSGMPVFAEDGTFRGYTGVDRDVTSRKQAEEALRKSEEKYRALVENSLVGIGISKGDQIVYANESLLRMFGYETFEEFAAKPILGHLTPASQVAVEQWWQRQRRGEEVPNVLEHDMVRKDGTIRTLQLSLSYLSGPDGIYTHAAFIDITERKQAEEALRQAKTFTDKLLNAPFDTVFAFEPATGKPVRWNKRFTDVSGYNDEEIAGMKAPDDFYDEQDLRKAQEAMTRILADGQGIIELSLITKRGVRIPFEYAATVVEPEDRKTLLLSVGRDITERKQAEEALRRSAEQFHQLFEDDLTGDFVCTPEGEILLCNPAFARIFGFSRAVDAVGTNIVDLYLGPGERQPLLERLKKEGRLERLEVWRKRRDGEPIYIVENVVGRFDEQGRLCEVKGYLFEDTQRKRAEEALRELTATLESRVAERTQELEQRARQLQKLTLELSEAEERERERVAAVLHDDLQQVLAAAKFQVSLLSDRSRTLAQSHEALGQVKEMLTSAIEKSRSLSHELSPGVLHRGDLAAAFDWLAEQMQTKHGLAVGVEASGAVAARSEAVKTLVYRSAQEMLFNVVKHAEVSEARLRIRRRGRYLCLSVSDRGRGFDPQEISRTAGLGLRTIRERVALLGGRMKIRSARGRGTTFHLVVPDAELRTNDGALEREPDSLPQEAGYARTTPS